MRKKRYAPVRPINDDKSPEAAVQVRDSSPGSTHLPPKAVHRIPRWKYITKHTIAATMFCSLVAWSIFLGMDMADFLLSGNRLNTRSIRLDDICEGLNATSVGRLFLLDLRVGESYTYLQARAIDISWDLLVGQGGKFLQAWILYYVAMDALVWNLEHATLLYDTVVALTFNSSSIISLPSLFKVLLRKRSWRTVLTMLWLLWATIHVLDFPTLWAAATSYINPTVTMYKMPDDTLVELDSEKLRPCVQIKDGSRIGLEDGVIFQADSFHDSYQKYWTRDYPIEYYMDHNGISREEPFPDSNVQNIWACSLNPLFSDPKLMANHIYRSQQRNYFNI